MGDASEMRVSAAIGALLLLGATALGCDALFGINVIDRSSEEDAGGSTTGRVDSGGYAGPGAEAGSEATEAGGEDAGASAVSACTLSALTISAGTLNPAFEPPALNYTITSSATSLGLPFTVTPTAASAGCSLLVNGAAVVSGEASSPILLGLMNPTSIDVEVTSLGEAATTHYALVLPPVLEAYVKPSNSRGGALFGTSVALSSDGNTLAVGSEDESSDATGTNGDQSDTSAPYAGAVYVFARTGTAWTQQAYIKASNTRASAFFGEALALSSDGNTLAVGSEGESSGAAGTDGNESDTSAGGAGAVYVFARTGTGWTQQAYVKASNTHAGASFGGALALSSDGNTLAVGSSRETSDAIGINGNESNTSAVDAGAVYVFARTGTAWTQQAYVKASNTREQTYFGGALALSSDGNTLAVGSDNEESAAIGINGAESDTSTPGAGAVYVFARTGTQWAQQAYVKASNTSSDAYFGSAVAISSDGDTLAVGSEGESSGAGPGRGAVYFFVRTGTAWIQDTYVKASNNGLAFGSAVALSSNGNMLAVGDDGEDSDATGINGYQGGVSAPGSGAVYVFARKGSTWPQQAYVKASNTRPNASFGSAVALSSNGDTLAVGSNDESSDASGINGDQSDMSALDVGAVYVLR